MYEYDCVNVEFLVQLIQQQNLCSTTVEEHCMEQHHNNLVELVEDHTVDMDCMVDEQRHRVVLVVEGIQEQVHMDMIVVVVEVGVAVAVVEVVAEIEVETDFVDRLHAVIIVV